MFGFGSDDANAPEEKRFSDGVIGAIKGTIKSAAKWALIAGAIGVTVAVAGFAIPGVGWAAAAVTSLASALGLGGGVTGAVAGAGLAALKIGAIVGAAKGALEGIIHFDENMEVAQEKRAMAHNNAMMRARNEAMFSAKMAGMGSMAPNIAFGKTRGMEGPGLG